MRRFLLFLSHLAVFAPVSSGQTWYNPDPIGPWGPWLPPQCDICSELSPCTQSSSVFFSIPLGRTSFERKSDFSRSMMGSAAGYGQAIGSQATLSALPSMPQRSFEEVMAFYQQSPLEARRMFQLWYSQTSLSMYSFHPSALAADVEGDAEKIYLLHPDLPPVPISNGNGTQSLPPTATLRQVVTDDYFADVQSIDVAHSSLPSDIQAIIPSQALNASNPLGFVVRVWFAEEKGAKTSGYYGIPSSDPVAYVVFYCPFAGATLTPTDELNIIHRIKFDATTYKTRSYCHLQNGNTWTCNETVGLPGATVIRQEVIDKTPVYGFPDRYGQVKTTKEAKLSPAGALGSLEVVSVVAQGVYEGKATEETLGWGSSRPRKTGRAFMQLIGNAWDKQPGYLVKQVDPDGYFEYFNQQHSGPMQEQGYRIKCTPWKDNYWPSLAYTNTDGSFFQPSGVSLAETTYFTPTTKTSYENLNNVGVFNYRTEQWGTLSSPSLVTHTGKLRQPNQQFLTTTTAYYPRTEAAHLANRIRWRENADGTAEYYSYSVPASGVYTRTVETGAGDRNGVTSGTRVVTTINKRGHAIGESTYHFHGGTAVLLESWVADGEDFFGRVTRRIWNGEVTDYDETIYDCCGIAQFRDRKGVVTQYFQDDLKRVYKKVVTAGSSVITTETDYDGLVTTTRRKAGSLDVLVNKTWRHLNGEIDKIHTADENGDHLPEETLYSYDYPTTGGKTITVTYPDGGTEITAYYIDGRVKSITGTAVENVSYDYGVSLVYENSYPMGLKWTLETKLTAAGAPTGEWTKTWTDVANRVYKVEYPTQIRQGGTNDHTLTTFYDQTAAAGSRGKVASFTDADGVTTSYTYDAEGNRSSVTEPVAGGFNRVTSTEHDAVSDPNLGGSMRTTTKVNGITTSVVVEGGNGYGSRVTELGVRTTTYLRSIGVGGDWVETVTHPDGTRSRKVYEDNFLVAAEKRDATSANSGLGNLVTSTTYTPDALQRVATSIDSRTGTTTLNSYTESGNLLSMTEPGSRTTSFGYDVMGRRTLVDQPDTAIVGGTAGNITRTSYYPSGKIKAVWGDQTYATFRLYDGQNRMTGLRTYRGLAHGTEPTSATTGYDATQWLYHAGRGWLSGKRDAADKGADYTYTAAGRLKTRTWARGKHTRYDYRAGYLVATRYFTNAASDNGTNAGNDPDTGDVGRTYDAFGRELHVVTTSSAQRPGTRIVHTYNATTTLHKIREVQQVDPDLSFTLGASNNVIAIDSGTIAPSFSRYVHRNVDSQLRHTGVDVRLTSSPSSTREGGNYLTYDADHGRITGVSPVEGLILPFSYSYVPGSNLVAGISSLSHTVTYTWHPTQDVMSGISSARGGTVFSAHSYTVNALGQRTEVSSSTSGGSGSYGYNGRGEVVNSTFPNSNFYLYDGMGNRLKHRLGAISDSGGTLTTYLPDNLNQYDSITQPGISFSPQYDLDGNMTSGPLPANTSQSSTLTWDGENRLIQSQTGTSGPVVKYVYDAYGRRLKKTTGGTSTYWCHDDWNPLVKYTGLDHTAGVPPPLTLQQRFLWGLDLSGTLQGVGGVGGLLSVNGNLIPFYDGNGNIVRHYTYVAGQTASMSGDGYSYDPFGKPVVTGTTPVTFKDLTDYGFSTKPMDAETGLYYYGYRYYDPVSGRWPSRDPIGEEGGLNLYGFLANDGISRIEQLGLSAFARRNSLEKMPLGAYLDIFIGYSKCECDALQELLNDADDTIRELNKMIKEAESRDDGVFKLDFKPIGTLGAGAHSQNTDGLSDYEKQKSEYKDEIISDFESVLGNPAGWGSAIAEAAMRTATGAKEGDEVNPATAKAYGEAMKARVEDFRDMLKEEISEECWKY